MYGALSFLARAITGCDVFIRFKADSGAVTVFGTYEWIQPEPIPMSEEEYQHMLRAQQHALTQFISRTQRLKNIGWRVAARLTWCAVWLSRDEREELKVSLRSKAAKADPSDRSLEMNDF